MGGPALEGRAKRGTRSGCASNLAGSPEDRVAADAAGIVSRLPITTRLGFLIRLARAIAPEVVPNRAAIPESVSPGRTTYV